jgi:hypothetical protein
MELQGFFIFRGFRFPIFYGLLAVSILLLFSCNDGISPVSPVPDVLVREEVNLNSIGAQPLRQRDGNFIYISGGIKGIIVYRKRQDEFLAFERKSPFNLEEDCGILKVPSSQFYMEDTCHQCTFNWEGQPLSGPCRSIAKQYRVQYSNAYTLLITNP